MPHRSTRAKERFGAIPRRLLRCPEFHSLSMSARYCLLCLAAEYNGHNNGNLTFTEADGRRYGIGHPRTRTHALRDLRAAGFIVKCHQGGKRPLGPTRWALVWREVNFLNNEKLERPTKAPECSEDHQYIGRAENKMIGTESVLCSGIKAVPREAK